MTSTRQDKKGSTKIATIVALSLILVLSPFLGGCPEERDIPVGVEPDEVTPAKSDEVVPDLKVWPEFFDKNLKLVSHPEGIIRVEYNVVISISTPEGVWLSATLEQDGRQLPRTLILNRRQGEYYVIRVIFPGPGDYCLTIYSLTDHFRRMMPVVRYKVEVNKGLPGVVGFPEVWSGFFEKNLEFVSHFGGIIQLEYKETEHSNVVVVVSAPKNIQLVAELEQDGQRLPKIYTSVRRERRYYVIEAVFPGSGKYCLIIFARERQEPEELLQLFSGVIRYTVGVGKALEDLLPAPIEPVTEVTAVIAPLTTRFGPVEIEIEPIVEHIIAKPTPGPTDIVSEANFEEIDTHALNVPGLGWECVESLAVYLTEPSKNDLEIARAIFRWITHNIAYDARGFLARDFGCQSPEAVLERGYAVCGGYARLFEALAYAAGLEAEVISGWARGFGYEIGEPIDESPNHAWNAVKIRDGWYLLDSTWAAGSLDDLRFVRRFREFYFLTCPEELIYTHFPENPDWQLLEVPVTKDEFGKLPLVRPGFFEKNLEFVSHPEGIIEVEHSVAATISAPEDVQLSARLQQDGQQLPRTLTFVQREGEYYMIEAVFPDPGDYSLIIFARKRGEAEEIESVIEYTGRVSEGLPGLIGFPETYGNFLEEEVYLYGPKARYLQAGSVQLFKLRVPRAESVAVIAGNEWHHLVKRDALFEGRVPIVTGEIGVAAKFPDREHYWHLLGYTGL